MKRLVMMTACLAILLCIAVAQGPEPPKYHTFIRVNVTLADDSDEPSFYARLDTIIKALPEAVQIEQPILSIRAADSPVRQREARRKAEAERRGWPYKPNRRPIASQLVFSTSSTHTLSEIHGFHAAFLPVLELPGAEGYVSVGARKKN